MRQRMIVEGKVIRITIWFPGADDHLSRGIGRTHARQEDEDRARRIMVAPLSVRAHSST